MLQVEFPMPSASPVKLRILFISGHCPHGPTYGAQLRTLHLARILKLHCELGMVLIPFDRIDDLALEKTRLEFDILGVFGFRKASSRSIKLRLRRELDPYCGETEGIRLKNEDARELDCLISKFDLIWFQGIAIPNCLGRRNWPQAILDIDDVPSQFFAARAREAKGWMSRLWMLRRSLLWRRRERVLLERFAIVGVCSERDRAYLGGDSRIHPIPNGFENTKVEILRKPTKLLRIGFIGTLRYAPNAEGLCWFIREVWPKIKIIQPNARLRVVGTDTDTGISDEDNDIDGMGFLADSAAEIDTWSMMVVPILVGGGTRIKIAEAFCRRCPVVSTSLGAYGYSVVDGQELMLADTPEDFAAACVGLIHDPSHAQAMADRARVMYDRELDWNSIAPRVRDAVDACQRQQSCGGSNSFAPCKKDNSG